MIVRLSRMLAAGISTSVSYPCGGIGLIFAFNGYLMPTMEYPLEDLSASQLRTLLIEKAKVFVLALDNADTQELEIQRNYVVSILSLLSEKEKKESLPLVWGKNSPDSSIPFASPPPSL